MRGLLPALLALAVLAAGCIETPGALTPSDDAGASPVGSGGSAGGVPWPALEDATVRPGVQVVSATGQCTSNFVFTSPDNASVYLGLAAHCVEGMAVGDAVDIADGEATGTLAYSSWITMEEVGETDDEVLDGNDFALVRVDDAHRAKVHPAVRHFGGPVALADSAGVARGDKVLTYGNSGIRQEVEPLSWHEGYVTGKSAWTTNVYTATPGIPGDSGSALLTADGRALGVVVTLQIAPAAGMNGAANLDMALAYALEHAGLDARLATWELLDAGVLPEA